MCDHSDRGDDERARNGIEALRAWFFLSVQRTGDPTDVTSEFPAFPEVMLQDEMDAPPEGFVEPPPGAMSVFDFYKSFAKDASKVQVADDINPSVSQREAFAGLARECLNISPEHKTAPHINVGVRFLFHLSHALKTLSPPGPTRVDVDPCMVVNMPLIPDNLKYLIPPHMVQKPTKRHKALWDDPEYGKYTKDRFYASLQHNYDWTKATAQVAGDYFTIGVRCPACKCDSDIAGRGAALAAMESQVTYLRAMIKHFCPHCGLGISGINPKAVILFGGLRPREH